LKSRSLLDVELAGAEASMHGQPASRLKIERAEASRQPAFSSQPPARGHAEFHSHIATY